MTIPTAPDLEIRPSRGARADLSAADLVARVRSAIDERRARTGALSMGEPQALAPLDADEIQPLEFHPWRIARGERLAITWEEVLQSPDDVFIARCTWMLFGRDPTERELHWARRVRKKRWARLRVIGGLCRSDVSRAAAAAPDMLAQLAGLLARWISRAVSTGRSGRSGLAVDRDHGDPVRQRRIRAPQSRPMLSICVTTYNRAAWLAHSLPLILDQARPFDDLVEVVVCDNASADTTPDVAKSLLSHGDFSYHRNEKNVGMLGNLGVSCDLAHGRYVWVIGDDDLLVEGAVERVLSAIAIHPSCELIYTNYAHTRFDRPEDLRDPEKVIRGAKAVSLRMRDQFAERVSEIAANSENCFTAIYCLVYREDHARRAYHQDVSGRPFSSLLTSVPTADYTCRHLLSRPGYWVGDPAVVVNLNVSWLRYASLFVLERFPELFDLMQQNGVEPRRMDELRAAHVTNLRPWFREIHLGEQRENLPLFSVERLVRRFGHLPAFQSAWPELERVYREAFDLGLVGDAAITPARLSAMLE